ncbi:6-carboxytetrahydropterin synthase [Crocinitomicaceae bacterium]|nr:6-carboxytetrahydropterin synthase [Crocinitomicaceae bacterium]
METSNYKVSVVRCEHFNAAHRLHNPKWNDKQNQEVFGKCNNPNYHGHNYELEVKVTGEVDPETGYVIDTKKLSNLIQNEVTEVFDHKNLNLDVPHFKNIIPSTENIAKITYDILRPLLDENLELKIKLYETPRNYVEYPG